MTFQDALHVLEIIDKECRMRLRCRTEVFLYTHVNLPIADPKQLPQRTAARGEF